jgi:hypothetical protein
MTKPRLPSHAFSRPWYFGNKRTFRRDCAKGKNGFVVGANCFPGAWAKKHLGRESYQPEVIDGAEIGLYSYISIKIPLHAVPAAI